MIALKKAYFYTLLVGVIIIIPLALFTSLNTSLNLGLGILIGIYPFFSWQVIYTFFLRTQCPKDKSLSFYSGMTKLKKTGLIGICLLKIILLGLVLFVIGQLKIMNPVPFIIGMILPLPIILVTVLLVYSKVKQ